MNRAYPDGGTALGQTPLNFDQCHIALLSDQLADEATMVQQTAQLLGVGRRAVIRGLYFSPAGPDADDAHLRSAAARTRYGYFRIYILPRRGGWPVNHKRVYRLCREESLRLKIPRRNVSAANLVRQP